MKKFFIISGEVSGDKHASHLVRALKNEYSNDLQIMGIGGDSLANEGVELIEHIKNISFLGLWEVVKNIKTIKKILNKTKEKILEFLPDAVILVDYPGFNLKIAEFAKKNHIKVIYYICPQIWAWGQNRVHKLKKFVDLFLVILPFEEEFYRKHGIKAHFIGHPSLESALPQYQEDEFYKNFHIQKHSLKIGLLPGSREMEVKSLLPVMVKAGVELQQKNQDIQFLISRTTHLHEDIYTGIIKNFPLKNWVLIDSFPYDIMSYSDFLWVASGTASLEAGLFEKPSIVLYKVNPITYHIGKLLVQVPYISLTNLILNEKVFPELIQHDCNPTLLWNLTNQMLCDENQLASIKTKLKLLSQKLNIGIASENAAKKIVDFLAKS
jgi:lipid-A-disaccharide synthase